MMCCQCLMTVIKQKMSQFITLQKHFHRQAYREKSELRIGGLGRSAVLEMWVVF